MRPCSTFPFYSPIRISYGNICIQYLRNFLVCLKPRIPVPVLNLFQIGFAYVCASSLLLMPFVSRRLLTAIPKPVLSLPILIILYLLTGVFIINLHLYFEKVTVCVRFFGSLVQSVLSTFSALFRLHNLPFINIIFFIFAAVSLILSNDF